MRLQFHEISRNFNIFFFLFTVETLFKRCKIMLSCHPEYRKLSSLSSLSTSSTIIQGISNRIESNFNQAVALLLAYIDTLEPFEQLQLLFGENDCQICPLLSDPMKKVNNKYL